MADHPPWLRIALFDLMLSSAGLGALVVRADWSVPSDCAAVVLMLIVSALLFRSIDWNIGLLARSMREYDVDRLVMRERERAKESTDATDQTPSR